LRVNTCDQQVKNYLRHSDIIVLLTFEADKKIMFSSVLKAPIKPNFHHKNTI